MSNVTGRTAPACWMTSILACCLSAFCLSAGCSQDVPPTTSIAPPTKRAADTASAEIVREPVDLPSSASTASDSEAPSVAKPNVIPLKPELPAVSPVKPVVILSAAHAETCLVNVGDPMPSMTLEDVEGAAQTLSNLYGEKLTVVTLVAPRIIISRPRLSLPNWSDHLLRICSKSSSLTAPTPSPGASTTPGMAEFLSSAAV